MNYEKSTQGNIKIFEVCLRDGLQDVKNFIPTYKKRILLSLIASSGINHIEATSFVNPKWVPQLQDASVLCKDFFLYPEQNFSVLVPNYKGFELSQQFGVKEVVTIISVSESHNKKNLNRTVNESLKEIERINNAAQLKGVKVRSYIATAFGCPIEGSVNEKDVLAIAEKLKSFGAYEVSLGDTTGMAKPDHVFDLVNKMGNIIDINHLALHLHQAGGLEFESILAGVDAGITTLDAAVSGLGGCPYAPGATGNIATERLVRLLHDHDYSTGVDQVKIDLAAEYANELRIQYEE